MFIPEHDQAGLRVDALRKLFSLADASGRLLCANSTDDEQLGLLIRSVWDYVRSATTYMTSQRANFADINASWWADVTSLDTCIASATEIMKLTWDAWKSSLLGVAKTLTGVCPPEALLNNSKLCTQADLQAALFDNPNKNTIKDKLNELSNKIRLWKILKDAGVDYPRDTYDVAIRARSLARTATGVEFALRKLVREAPADPTKIQEHAVMIKDKLAKKGITVPPFLMSVLDKVANMSPPCPSPASKVQPSVAKTSPAKTEQTRPTVAAEAPPKAAPKKARRTA